VVGFLRMMWLETLKRSAAAAAGRMGFGRSGTHDAATPEVVIVGREAAAPAQLDDVIASSVAIDTTVDAVALARMLAHVETCWRRLGETEPHWSVLTNSRFKSDRIAETRDEFYASGEGDVRRLLDAANRRGVVLPFQGTCFELGCGVGRLTPWLARSFGHVIATDISESHLALAEQAIRSGGCRNVELRQVNQLEALEQLPMFDCFLSLIVLQHNPPPVIRWLLLIILSKLRIGGVGFFQVPTALPAYSFDAEAYLANPPSDGLMEMHALPLEVVLSTIREAGCELLEVNEHDVADSENAMFVEFLVRRRHAGPSEQSLAQR
jgi:SAM-dependent methyltransferase